eukprot:scaffold215527_cov24-Prasinocladus_malaysianus.AAC.1
MKDLDAPVQRGVEAVDVQDGLEVPVALAGPPAIQLQPSGVAMLRGGCEHSGQRGLGGHVHGRVLFLVNLAGQS